MQSFPGAKVVEASDMNIVTRTHIHHVMIFLSLCIYTQKFKRYFMVFSFNLLPRFYFQRIAGNMTENTGIGNVTRELVHQIASANFPDLVVGDRDIVRLFLLSVFLCIVLLGNAKLYINKFPLPTQNGL